MNVNAAQALTITAAGALVIVAYELQRAASASNSDDDDTGSDWTDEIDAALSSARNAVMPTPVANMSPSQQLQTMLKREEACTLSPIQLGDGGWTLGWGRYFPYNGGQPPAQIDQATADQWCVDDLEARGARWVRTYDSVPLTQYQFDALVSMAYNLRPASFRTIADAVNAGQDPEAAALQYVRAGTNLEAGLRNRRAGEINLYRSGMYA